MLLWMRRCVSLCCVVFVDVGLASKRSREARCQAIVDNVIRRMGKERLLALRSVLPRTTAWTERTRQDLPQRRRKEQ